MYEVVKAAAWKVMAPLVPGAYRLTASASAPRPASSSTGSLNTSAPTGMVTARRPPNLSSRFVPGTRVEPVFWTPMYAWPITIGALPKLLESRMRQDSPQTLGWTRSEEHTSELQLH